MKKTNILNRVVKLIGFDRYDILIGWLFDMTSLFDVNISKGYGESKCKQYSKVI